MEVDPRRGVNTPSKVAAFRHSNKVAIHHNSKVGATHHNSKVEVIPRRVASTREITAGAR